MSLFALLTRILFVGHSLVGPDLPPMVEGAMVAMDRPAEVQAQIINGASLAYNWDHSADAEGVDGRALLADTPTDVLVLTESQPVAAQIEWGDSAGRVAEFARLARAQNPLTRVFLYETWPSLNTGTPAAADDDPARALPWGARIAAELPLWQGIARAAQQKGAGEVRLIPAGQAMARLETEIAAGRVPGMTSIRDAFSDDIHPNAKGLYLVAMVQVAAITGTDPTGLPARLTRQWPSREAVVADDLAPVLQRIAWETVGAMPAGGTDAAAADTAAIAATDIATAAGGDTGNSAAGDAATPAADPVTIPAPITNPNLALGLAGVQDWSVQQPFLDVMKTARPWTGHLPGQWGGWSYDRIAAGGYLDAEGWPTAIPPGSTALATLLLTELPPDTAGVAGRYRVTWQGRGVMKIEGRARIVEEAPNRVLFDYTPGPGAVILTITVLDPVDPIRNISIVREDRAALLDAGQIFNPDWLARIRGVRMVRFMDWMATNDSTLSRLADRPKPADFTWGRNGVPMEVMVALANELGADPWFTIPHLADDDLVRKMAEIARDGLNPDLRAWVEFSNEVWNWQFAQARWAEEQGRERWGRDGTWVQYYAMRAAQVMDIWRDTMADPDRLMRVVATQTGWLGLEEQILNAPLVVAEGGRPPAESFDAYAITGYFAALLGSDEKAPLVRGWLAQGEAKARALAAQELRDGSVSGKDEDTLSRLTGTIWPWHARVARAYGLRLAMYEGGTHVVGMGAQTDDAELTAFFIGLNYSAEMGALYQDLLAAWARVSDTPFNAFVDVLTPAKWGSWGALRHLGDDNPRWQALAKGCGQC